MRLGALGALARPVEGDEQDVDFADYQKLEVNFGAGVPEPCTLLLLAGRLVGLRRRRSVGGG